MTLITLFSSRRLPQLIDMNDLPLYYAPKGRSIHARKLLTCFTIVFKYLVLVFLAGRLLSGFVLNFWFDQFIHGKHSMLFKGRPLSMNSKTKVLLTCSTPTNSWWLALARVTWRYNVDQTKSHVTLTVTWDLVWSTLYRQHFKHVANEIVS